MDDNEREELGRWARRAKSTQALALRSRIVLACAEGADNTTVAAQLSCSTATAGKWRSRYVEHRLDGLVDEVRPGREPSITADQVEDVVVATLESTPKNATHWSRAKMADRTGLSKSSIGRIWKASNLKPHRVEGLKLSNDPLFVKKVQDVVGLHLDSPESAVVLSVDEKSRAQALSRSQHALPRCPVCRSSARTTTSGTATTSLFAALNVADSTVISSTHRRHRAVECEFLTEIDTEVPDDLDVHVICDNCGTHKHPMVTRWLEAHPRFTMHFTPT